MWSPEEKIQSICICVFVNLYLSLYLCLSLCLCFSWCLCLYREAIRVAGEAGSAGGGKLHCSLSVSVLQSSSSTSWLKSSSSSSSAAPGERKPHCNTMHCFLHPPTTFINFITAPLHLHHLICFKVLPHTRLPFHRIKECILNGNPLFLTTPFTLLATSSSFPGLQRLFHNNFF